MKSKCAICGIKFKADNRNFASSFGAATQPDFMVKTFKQYNVFSCDSPVQNRNAVTVYCDNCIAQFNTLTSSKTTTDIAYNYFKKIIETGNLQTRDFDAKRFNQFLEESMKGYNENKKYQKVVSNVEALIVEKRKELEEKYGSYWESPTEYEHRHMCATRYENNLIILEDRKPKFNFLNDIDKANKTYDKLKTISNEDLFMMSIIPLENILSYQLVGNVEHVATVSGGGGQGGQPNLYGAVVGGLLFGGAGAILGAQTGVHIDPIKSDIKEFDSRKTLLNLKNSQGQAEIRELPYYYSEVFMKVIPEKEFNFLQADKNTEASVQAQTTPASNMIEEVKKLKELLNLNLITQEQFTTLVSSIVVSSTKNNSSGECAPAPETNDYVEVELTSAGDKKLHVFSAICEITILDEVKALELIQKTPVTLINKIERKNAEKIKSQLEGLGATITIR